MDDDGYPTDDELDALSNFTGTAREFFAAVHDLWSYKDFVTETTVTDDFRREVVEIRLVTGGWSGNESVAGVIADTLVHFMWWQSSASGGLTVYRVPVSMYDTPFGSGFGWLATTVEDEAESLREWKANAEITLAENKRVIDRDAALLEAVDEALVAWERVVCNVAGAVGADQLEFLGKVTSDLRAALAANPDQMSTAAAADGVSLQDVVRAMIAEGEAHLSMDEPYLGVRWLNHAGNAPAFGGDRADWALVYLPRLRAALSSSTGA